MPQSRHMPQLATYVKSAAEHAIDAYIRYHRLSPYHPEASDTYVIPVPTDWLTPETCERLARQPDGGYFYNVDIEVAIEVQGFGWDWSLEVALLTVRTPTPERPYRQIRRVLAIVSCDDKAVTVDTLTEGIRAFGVTLAPTLLAVASGQFS